MRRNSEVHQLQLKLIAVPTLNEFLALFRKTPSVTSFRHAIEKRCCGEESGSNGKGRANALPFCCAP